jgi:hypothetical protein
MEATVPSNNNIHTVVLASGNDKKTLNYSHQPRKKLNKPVKQGPPVQFQPKAYQQGFTRQSFTTFKANVSTKITFSCHICDTFERKQG